MYAAYDALSAPMRELVDPLYAIHDSSMTFGAGGRNKTFQVTSHIDGMHPHESRALLDFLLRHVTQATFQVRLTWRPHTVAMWDNRATQHYVTADYNGRGRRYMHRVTVLGDRPV